MSDIDTAAADSLKVLDPKRPIREADIDSRALSATIRPWDSTSAKWKTGASKRLRTKRLRSA